LTYFRNRDIVHRAHNTSTDKAILVCKQIHYIYILAKQLVPMLPVIIDVKWDHNLCHMTSGK